MSSPVLDASAVRGRQDPRVLSLPRAAVGSKVDDALALWDLTGRRLDPWQTTTLEAITAVDAADDWVSSESGLLVSRQQGKGEILQAYDLAHLFVWPSERDEPKIILHTGHEYANVEAHYRKLKRRIMSVPWMRRQLKGGGRETSRGVSGISTGMGKLVFELENGNLLILQTRTGSAGIGQTVDVLIVDEAQHSSLEAMEALLYTQDAVPHAQTLYTGTAPTEMQDGAHFEGVRDRGRTGSPRTAWVEFSPDGSDDPDLADGIDITDPKVWAQGNPGLGIRLEAATIQDKLEALGADSFKCQRLSIWPNRRPPEHQSANDVDMRVWGDSGNPAARHGTGLCLSVSLGIGYGSICCASRTADGRIYVEHRATRAQVLWIPDVLADLYEAMGKPLVVLDAKNCAPILDGLERKGVKPMKMSVTEIAGAFGIFAELANEGGLIHRNQAELTTSLKNAKTRAIGSAGQTWEQSDPTEPVTQTLAMTHAVWGVHRRETDKTTERSGKAVFRG